jgi:hypothetical protein
MCYRVRPASLVVAVLLASCTDPGSPPGCEDPAFTERALSTAAEFLAAEMQDEQSVFVGGYAMRTLVTASDVLDEPRYLSLAAAFADSFLADQGERGYWSTGYSGNVYLADAASALGLLFTLYPRVDAERQTAYRSAVARHLEAVEADSLIRPEGAIGVGWQMDEGTLYPFRDAYTIASALTGGAAFSWMYEQTGEERYRDIAWEAITWILKTLRKDGVFPYVLAGHGADFERQHDASHFETLWNKWPYDTSSYVGEGLMAFATHAATDRMKRYVHQAATVHVDFLLRTQNEWGTWGLDGSDDQKRSPGVINFLSWYSRVIDSDPRIDHAICRYLDYTAAPENARSYGLLYAGGNDTFENRILTAFHGYALAELARPGSGLRW